MWWILASIASSDEIQWMKENNIFWKYKIWYARYKYRSPNRVHPWPTIYNIYINDISKVDDLFAFIVYADDTTLSSILSAFKSNTDQLNTESKIKNELSKISTWLIVNKLSLRVNEYSDWRQRIKITKYIVLHTKQKKINAPIIKK